ncbi:MAG: NADH:flavin oxidoreductase [Candidatus Rokubacteria bacterium]|nr:NADH:flavin oxidoreductase [Candidatus Rokubacteria bacterium]
MSFPGAAAYPTLFSPFTLGGLRLPNRFSVPGLTTNYATPDGFVTDALCEYLAARARGGFGLIVTENLGVHPAGRVMPRMVMIDDDRYVAGLARLASAVRREGGVVVGQLSHAGRQTKSRITGLPLVAPSAVPCPINREMPRALAVDEIQELAQAFVRAAVRLADAGFDGVEIHGAHGYLVGAFLSRYANRRDDAFGGPLDNRLRFLLDIVDGIQRALGRDFPLIVRLSAREFVPDGLDLPEAIEIARRLRDRGVHALSVSVGVYESFNKLSMVAGEPEGQWLPLAAAIRSATGLPTIGVGRIKRARVAEAALASGQIDLAAFGRASIADPELPRKVRDGEEARVLWCFGCNVCLGRSARPETICPVNPAVGREATFMPAAAARPVRLAIRGSSFAALTAAWVAARRGHSVTLHEPGPVLGGLQGLRARVPGQEEVGETIEALAARATAAGVRLIRGEPEPGAHDVLWEVRGPAAARGRTVTSYDVLASPGDYARAARAIVTGDDLASAHAALVLADAGVAVELRSPARDIAVDAHPGFREVARRGLSARGATIVTEAGGEPVGSPAADPLRVVAGHDADTRDGDLNDAYEPGRLAAAVYDAAARAAQLDG